MKVPSYIYDCWNCGGPGISYVGSAYICPRCDVTWRPTTGVVHKLPDHINYNGMILRVVDFNDPATISSPA